jgi:hypothetical protein
MGLLFGILMPCVFSVQAKLQLPDSCYASFQDFAYRAPLLDRDQMSTPLLPDWLPEATLPSLPEDGTVRFEIPVATTQLQGNIEIWIRSFRSFASPTQSDHFLVYRPLNQTWETISSNIEGTNVYVDNLYVLRDGSVWGRTNWNSRETTASLTSIPALANFNTVTRRFEFSNGVVEVARQGQSIQTNALYVVEGMDGEFWLFTTEGHIYLYSTTQQLSQKVADLSTLPPVQQPTSSLLRSAALADDRMLYFQTYSSPLLSPPYRVHQNTLYQLDTTTYLIQPVVLPESPWPIFSGILVDQSERLWLGATGYRSSSQSWTLIHPEASTFFDLIDGGGFSYLWAPAALTYESSDGRLWFNRFLDTSGWGEGLAWLDPATNQGCLITNRYTTIVEDKVGRLWFIADRNLYMQTVQ